MKRYSEPISASRGQKEVYLSSVRRFIESEQEKATKERADALLRLLTARDTVEKEKMRARFRMMLGIPAPKGLDATPEMYTETCGEDDYGKVYRVSITVMPDFRTGGILMLPQNKARQNASGAFPLVICQHGGGGTPEYLSDFFEEECGENAYCHMTEQALSAGFAVFAPLLLLWKFTRNAEEKRPAYDLDFSRNMLDISLKQLGYSMTGLEIFCLSRMLSAVCARPDIDAARVGMAGVSYGGYFSLYTMASDTRIRAAYSAAAFNDRAKVCFGDWCYQGAAYAFFDAEAAGLCAPRPLFVDVGKADTVFDFTTAVPEAERARQYYRAAGAEENFSFFLHGAGHRHSPDTDRFLCFLNRIDSE